MNLKDAIDAMDRLSLERDDHTIRMIIRWDEDEGDYMICHPHTVMNLRPEDMAAENWEVATPEVLAELHKKYVEEELRRALGPDAEIMGITEIAPGITVAVVRRPKVTMPEMLKN